VEVEWREGTKGPLASRFLALRVRPANVRLHRADPDGELPLCWLLAEWPPGKEEPTDFWLSNLPADTPIEQLVSLAKLRWRVEQDYRELKDALGLDHFEGRSYPGWNHHVTLVSVAHGFLTMERLRRPRLRGGRLTSLFEVVRELQELLACWQGTCPTCRRRLPPDTLYLHPPGST